MDKLEIVISISRQKDLLVSLRTLKGLSPDVTFKVTHPK